MSFPYPTRDQTAEYIPVALQLLKGQSVPFDKAGHSGWVVGGYGLSFWPGEPKMLGAREKYGKAEAIADLESISVAPEKFGDAENQARAKALPWNLIIAMIFAAIQELMNRNQA